MKNRPSRKATVYLHYPCFDGLMSATIAADFAKTDMGLQVDQWLSVGYDRAGDWLKQPLPDRSIVVDFLYHPDALMWADHHATTFLTDEIKLDFEKNAQDRFLVYDRAAPSCAGLLFRKLEHGLSNADRLREMADWADTIDSANYESVQQAIFDRSPAMEISRSLADRRAAAPAYVTLLLDSLQVMRLEQVAMLPEVREMAGAVSERIEHGLAEVEKNITLSAGDIAVARTTQTDTAVINRYSPYVFLPDARYSVTLVNSQSGAKITAMRNPWRNFNSVQLGDIFKKYGGGGHQRVASVIIDPNSGNASEVLDAIVEDIRTATRLERSARRKAYA